MRIMLIALAVLLILGCTACKEKPEQNTVDIEQIDVDDSNDYRYIFREEIQKDRDRESRKLKKEFRDRSR